MNRIGAIAGLAFCALLAACDSPAGPTPTQAPARLEALAGDLQTSAVGGPAGTAPVVRVTDANGAPVPGQTVRFRVTAGGGSLAAEEAVTDAGGRASSGWLLGTVARDTQRVEASLPDAPALEAVRFRAVGTPAAAALLTRLGPVRAGALDSLSVRVTDRFGNGVGGQSVQWSAAGGGVVTPAVSTSDASGVARTVWQRSGAATQTATAAFGSAAPVVFTLAIAPPSAFSLSAVRGAGQTGLENRSLADSLVVVFRDQGGRPVPGAIIEWSATGAGTSHGQTLTRVDGTAAVAVVLGAAGTATIQARSQLGDPPVTFQATSLRHVFLQLRRGVPAAVVTGTQLELEIHTIGEDGLGLVDVPVTVRVVQGGGTVDIASATTPFQVIWTVGPQPGTHTVMITAPGADSALVVTTVAVAPQASVAPVARPHGQARGAQAFPLHPALPSTPAPQATFTTVDP